MQDARLILLDEPFTAVDQRTTADLLALVQRWHAEHRTVIAVLHDFEQVRSTFPQVLYLARESVGWGPTPSVLTAANQLRARAMAETFLSCGYDVVSGGTDNHLFLLDLSAKGYTGKAADAALGQAFITVNKNAVPNDKQSPFVTSGIRIGTPAVTTRGFREDEVRTVARWMCEVMDHMDDQSVILRVREQVRELCSQFPVYAGHGA